MVSRKRIEEVGSKYGKYAMEKNKRESERD
jgi:hypothetical protein